MRSKGLALLAVAVAVGCGVVALLARSSAHSAPVTTSPSASIIKLHPWIPAPASTFESVVPACGCTGRTVITQYSLSSGRPLRDLALIRSSEQISDAASDRTGDLWMTFSTGPALSEAGVAGGDPHPDSCTGKLVRYDPRTGVTQTEWTFPPDISVGNAVPSPDGQRVAVLEGGCSTSYFNQHIVVVDLHDHRSIDIGADATPCHALFDVAWNPAGTQLVFPYGPSPLPIGTHFTPNGTCAVARWSRIAVVSGLRPSTSRSWRLWKATGRCSYESAAFDAEGIAASEACSAPGENDPISGEAYLIQLSRTGARLASVALRKAWDSGDVVSDLSNRQVLISEDQGGNIPGARYYHWIWSWAGRRLTLVGHYPEVGFTDIMAQPL